MPKRPVFYSFHYNNDVMRVQLIRNIGSIDGNQPASPNDWEKIKRGGDRSIQNWIDNAMKYKQCVIVLIGSETAYRPWVRYEIQKAWNENRPIFGIYIHNLKCPRNGKCHKGENPFRFANDQYNYSLDRYITCYDPPEHDAYGYISRNIEDWIEIARNGR